MGAARTERERKWEARGDVCQVHRQRESWCVHEIDPVDNAEEGGVVMLGIQAWHGVVGTPLTLILPFAVLAPRCDPPPLNVPKTCRTGSVYNPVILCWWGGIIAGTCGTNLAHLMERLPNPLHLLHTVKEEATFYPSHARGPIRFFFRVANA